MLKASMVKWRISMNTKGNYISNHIYQYRLIYFFMIVLFLIGVIFGSLIVINMEFVQQQDLFFYIQQYMTRLVEGSLVENIDVFKTAYFYHVQYLIFFFILGISIIGLPVIWVLMFIKGIVVGFSVGFFVNQMGWQGLLLAAAGIAPQNIFIIPIYLIGSSVAMIFSLNLMKKLLARRTSQPHMQPFIEYCILFLVLIIISIAPAFIEAYVANEVFGQIVVWLN